MANRVAVVTMVYNEDVFLPLWARYYTGQFNAQSCYVIDHGSDDGTTDRLGDINVVRIPRSPQHDKKRAHFLSSFCSALLEWYDCVIYCDVDEFLIPDPASFGSLRAFTDQLQSGVTVTAIGVDVTHLPELEPAIDLNRAVLGQRCWARFSFAMCKPLVTTSPIEWTPGFHSSDRPLLFDRLYLFHLNHFDLPVSLRRLAKTRAMPWGDGSPDHYQRWPDEKHEKIRRAVARLPQITTDTFLANDSVIEPRLQWMREFVEKNPEKKHLFYYNNGIPCEELLRIPDRFFGLI